MFVSPFRSFGRIVRTFAVVLFVATMLPMPGFAAFDDEPDFSAALLLPSDLDQLGFEDYGVDSGRTMTLPQMIRDSGNPEWDDPMYTEVGIDWVYASFLHPVGGLDANDGADININTMIFVYADEDGADEGFDVFEDESDDPTATDLDNAPELGDDSEMTEYVDVWVEDGKEYEFHAIDISIRIGNVVGVVTFNGYDAEVDRDDVEAAGEYFEEKLLGVIENGEIDGSETPGLGNLIPRYEGDEVMVSRSHYCSLDGEVVVHAYDARADELTQARIDEFGMVANYCAIQKLMLGADDEDYLLLHIQPSVFERSSGAAEYIEVTVVDELSDDPEFEVEELDVDDLPIEADEAWTVRYAREIDGLETEIAELIVRDGKYVYEVRLNGFEAPDLDAMMMVLADLGDCVEDGCTRTFDLPDELADFLAEQIETYEDQ
jgi:hypothetical protein